MYEEYWGLKEKPFENTPDPRFFFKTPNRQMALLKLLYAISERKGALLVGEYGCGKTLMTRAVLQELKPDSYDLALIVNPNMKSEELLRLILYEFGIETDSSDKDELLKRLNTLFLDNYEAERGTIIVIDEAHLIKDEDTLEDLRMLMNFQLNDVTLVSMVFAAHPRFLKRIDRMPQLKQRLSVIYQLDPLGLEETHDYIKHRLEVAGCSREIFSQEALDLIFRSTGGVPRKINNLCDMSLLMGFIKKAEVVDETIVEEAMI
jgi:general secretion pathway protein A